jgi:hypothetical protein
VRDAPASSSLSLDFGVRYAKAAVSVEDGALIVGLRLASIRGSWL